MKDIMNDRRKELFNCTCGARLTRGSRNRHMKSKVHADSLEQKIDLARYIFLNERYNQ